MTLKQLKTKYDVLPLNGKYVLFSKTEGGVRLARKYVWEICKNKRGNKFYVKGFTPTSNLDELETQIKNKVKLLPYDAEYYMPMYVKGLFEELIIHDYLNSLGFEGHSSEGYCLKHKNIYGHKGSEIYIGFSGLNPKYDNTSLSKSVTVSLSTEKYSWVQSTVKRNVKDIKKAIDSLLKPLLLGDSVSAFSKSEKLKNAGSIDIILQEITKKIEMSSQNYKSVLKERLTNLVATL